MDQKIADYLASLVEKNDPAKAALLSAAILAVCNYGKAAFAGLASKIAPSHPKLAIAIAEALKFV